MRSIAEYVALSGLRCREQNFLKLAGTRLVYSDPARFVCHYEVSADPNADGCRAAEALLLRSGSIISTPHGHANPAHAEPRTTGAMRIGYRPPRYGRAAIFPIEDETGRFAGLLDVKGCGVGADRTPELGTTHTGLLFMHEALTEVINAAVLRRLFARDRMALESVPFYGVVDTGLRARVAWAETRLPCATLLRRAEIRPENNNELPLSGSREEQVHHRIEQYLLSRGLTTAGDISTLTVVRERGRWISRLDGDVVQDLKEEIVLRHLRSFGLWPPQIFHFSNVQIARRTELEPLSARLIDLGHIRATGELAGHLVTFVDDRMLNWGLTTLKGAPDWPRPDPETAIRLSRLGRKLVSDGEVAPDLLNWLRPTELFAPSMAGVVLEALKLAKGIAVDGLGPADVAAAIEEIAVDAVPQDSRLDFSRRG